VEIPDAEQERVTSILHESEHGRLNSVCPGVDDCQLWYDAEIRTAYLLPALPYLAPAACTCPTYADVTPDMRTETGQHLAACPLATHHAAPAGDGGLREALEKLAKDWSLGVTAVGPARLRDLLAAHPAAPAVPQPVDREALAAAVYEKSAAVVLDGGYITTLIAPEDAVAAVLAVLAGEQEQVEP
jgi:hypothetical protein